MKEANIEDIQKKMSGETTEPETEEEQEEMENIQQHEEKEAKEIIQINTPEINFEELTPEEIQTKYIQIKTKLEKNQKLTEDEEHFKIKIEEAMQKAEQKADLDYQQKLLEAKEEELNKREEFLKEYTKVKNENPERIIRADMNERGLNGETSLLKAVGFFLSMKKPKQKGGKILIKVFRDKRVTIEWSNKKDLTYVEFHSQDEKGNDLIEITRFNEFIHTFEGTPVPVLFAVQGIPEGYNFFESMKKDITAEMMSQMTLRAYHAGFIKGAELINPNANKNNILELLTKFMPLILIVGLIAILWLLNQNYESMKVVYQTMQVMQSQMNTLVPVIDANAIIYR